MEIKLKRLSETDGRDIYEMLQEIPAEENGFQKPNCGRTYDEYQQWLRKSDAFSRTTALVDGWKVPTTVYWLYVDGRPVGMGKLRHFLTDKLLAEGGHAGYAIRPSERKKGYSTILLRELLKEARAMNIDKLLVTVRNGNSPSLRVALRNGGIIERQDEIRSFIWIDC